MIPRIGMAAAIALAVLIASFLMDWQVPEKMGDRLIARFHAAHIRVLHVTRTDIGTNIITVSIPGCASPVNIFAALITLEDQPALATVIGPHLQTNYIYMGERWTTLDRNRIWFAYIRAMVRNLARPRALVGTDDMIALSSPQVCEAARMIDWRPVWDTSLRQ